GTRLRAGGRATGASWLRAATTSGPRGSWLAASPKSASGEPAPPPPGRVELGRLAKSRLELGQPSVQRGLALHHDLELAVRQPANAAGMRWLQGDDDRLARDAEAIEDLEDPRDAREGDRRQRRHASVSSRSGGTAADVSP